MEGTEMPKSSKAKLAYMAAYQKTPEEVHKRVERNAARRLAIREGKVHVGDGLQVDHIVQLDSGGTNAKGNTRVATTKKNEAWRKTNPKAYTKK
jgi:hypothetical protein